MIDAEYERELLDRMTHAEICSELEVTSTPEAPIPPTEKEIMRRCGLSRAAWAHVRSIKSFRARYQLSGEYWTAWTPYVIDAMRSVLLRNFRSASDLAREKAEASQRKAAARQAATVRRPADLTRDGKPFQKSAEERAAIGERMKAAWAKRKANGGYGLRKLDG